MKLLHLGTVSDGKMRFDNRKMLDDHIKELDGKRFGMLLGEEEHTRSVRQNNYVWGVCYPLMAEAFRSIGDDGVNSDVVHGLFKKKFLTPKKVYSKVLNEITEEYSTKSLTTKEFNDYTENLARWSAVNLSLVIPLPDPDLRRK